LYLSIRPGENQPENIIGMKSKKRDATARSAKETLVTLASELGYTLIELPNSVRHRNIRKAKGSLFVSLQS